MGDRMATLVEDIKARAHERAKSVLTRPLVVLKLAKPDFMLTDLATEIPSEPNDADINSQKAEAREVAENLVDSLD